MHVDAARVPNDVFVVSHAFPNARCCSELLCVVGVCSHEFIMGEGVLAFDNSVDDESRDSRALSTSRLSHPNIVRVPN